MRSNNMQETRVVFFNIFWLMTPCGPKKIWRHPYQDKSNNLRHLMSVISNRGAAAPLGDLKSYKGATKY